MPKPQLQSHDSSVLTGSSRVSRITASNPPNGRYRNIADCEDNTTQSWTYAVAKIRDPHTLIRPTNNVSKQSPAATAKQGPSYVRTITHITDTTEARLTDSVREYERMIRRKMKLSPTIPEPGRSSSETIPKYADAR